MIKLDVRSPGLYTLVPRDAFVFRSVSSISVFRPVPNILCGSSRAKICRSIIKAVAVDMIYEHIVRYFKYLAVHVEPPFGAVFGFHCTYSVVATFTSPGGIPFILRQAPVIVGIDDCILALCERDSAEGIAIAQAPIQKHRRPQQPYEPERYGYGKLNDTPPLSAARNVEFRIMNLEFESWCS